MTHHSAGARARSGPSGVVLAMIVRDEAAVIERCLSSVRPWIDHWVICDTGSVDDTIERVEAELADLPGRLVRAPWTDFATNRNQLLTVVADEMGDRPHHLLLLDADMTVEVDDGVLDHLDADGYLLPLPGPTTYWMPYLVRGGLPWRYVGATHEYLTCDVAVDYVPLPGLRVLHWADGGTRHEKLERDLRLLEEHDAAHPDDQRTTFYLAQTRRDLGRTEEAARTYLRRAALGGWDEEVFCALLEAGRCLAGYDWDAAVPVLLRAHDVRPHRVEPLFELARGFRHRGHHRAADLFSSAGVRLAPSGDRLFVDTWIETWGMRFEHSVVAWWAGRPEEALELCDALLADPALPAEHRAQVEENRQFCLGAIGG